MNDLNEVWEQLIAEAAKNPPAALGEGFAEFLAVKNANDAVRESSIGWLLGTMRAAAEHANQKGVGIKIESTEPHRFSIGAMRLGGEQLKFSLGIRSLTVEAGWTRAPGDGFMRGNALAIARLTHFGVASANAELHLVKFEDEPRWFTVTKLGLRVSFEIEDLIRHFQIFLDLGE